MRQLWQGKRLWMPAALPTRRPFHVTVQPSQIEGCDWELHSRRGTRWAVLRNGSLASVQDRPDRAPVLKPVGMVIDDLQRAPYHNRLVAQFAEQARTSHVLPPNVRAVFIAFLDALALRFPWGGYDPKSDSTVKCFDVSVAVSIRQLAEAAGVSRATAGRALQMLIKQRFIVVRVRSSEGNSTTYALSPVLIKWLGHAFDHYRRAQDAEKRDSSHIDRSVNMATVPVFRICPWDSLLLGHRAEWVYLALTAEKQTITGLARATNLNRDTASKHLVNLAKYGLAAKIGCRWVRGEADVEQVALLLGADAAADRRAGIHTAERVSEGFE